MPTKSGIMGMIGCAMGLERGNPKLAAMGRELQMAVRADRSGTELIDYQTVQAERLLTAEGKPRTGGNTLVSYRTYLQDACFTVAIAGDQKFLESIQDALRHPKWAIYLGRKACVPSRPVLDAITMEFSSLEDAMMHLLPASERVDEDMLIEMDCVEGDADGTQYERQDALADGDRNFFRRPVVQKRRNSHVS